MVRDVVWKPAQTLTDRRISSHFIARRTDHALVSTIDRGRRAVDQHRRRDGRRLLRPGQGRPHRLPEIRQAGAAQGQRLAGRKAEGRSATRWCGPNFRPGRRCWRRSMSAPSISAIPAKRRRSSRRPPARRSSMSPTSRRRRRARRSWCPKDSALKSVADLKGKKVALNKGSNVHYLLVKALEKAGVKYSEIEPVFLAPADARAAFERGAVDAWVIWDPFQAAAEAATGARTLADGTGIVANYQFYFSSKKFLAERSEGRRRRAGAAQRGRRLGQGRHPCGRRAARAVGRTAGRRCVEVALKRQSYGIKPINDGVIADQQQDRRHASSRSVCCRKPIKSSDVATQAGILIMTIHTLRPPAPTSSGSCRPMATAAISAPPPAAAR